MGTLTNLGCDDDSGPGATSLLTISVSSGTAYYVQAGGFDNATGTLAVGMSFVSAGDSDNDGYTDVAESGAPLCANSVNDDNLASPADDSRVNDGCPPVGQAEADCTDTTSTGLPLDDDGDGANNDGCQQVGSYSEGQFRIGTGPQDPCGNSGWPSDLSAAGQPNTLNLLDITSFRFDSAEARDEPWGLTGFDSRWDLSPGGGSSPTATFINLLDITARCRATLMRRRGHRCWRESAFGQACPFPP